MKIFFSICISFSFITVFGQSFLPFHKERPAYYQFADSYDIFYKQAAISIDSFQISGTDTLFYHYPLIDVENGVCYLKAHDTSFVGLQSIRTANSYDHFFNRNGDTILLKNNAVLNESWELFHFNGNKIIATVESMALEAILGTDDSVKVISLQAEDNAGNNIPHIFNNKIFKIGKSSGLVSGYSLFHFPIDTIAFSLVGLENPSQGLNAADLTAEKIFDFNIGDRFDFIGGANTEPSYHALSHETFKVLGKEVLGNGDSLVYTFDYKRLSQFWNQNDYSETSFVGVISDVYVLSEYDFLEKRPFEFYFTNYGNGGGYLYLGNSYYEEGATVKIADEYSLFPQSDDCLGYSTADAPPIEKYAEGLGKVYSYGGDNSLNNYDTLV
ncbi:MAG: hypothetical protein H0V65_01335, partial [Chitinophagales bacterium]|nr:hypothetical protein [Chitinophagales bacterium]